MSPPLPRAMTRALRLAGSWWATALLASAHGALFAWAAFGDDAYLRWEGMVLESAWGMALYAALMMQLVLASLRVAFERRGAGVHGVAEIERMDAWVRLDPPPEGGRDAVAAWMARAGYPPVGRGDGPLVSRRGAMSWLPGTVMRAGLVMVMAAVLMGANLREEDGRAFRAGERAELLGTPVRVERIEVALPRSFLQVGDKSIMMLDEIGASVEVAGQRGGIGSGYPARLGGLYLRTVDMGYYADVSVDGAPPEGAYLRVLPPGARWEIGGGVSAYIRPVRELRQGLLKGLQYDLASPSLGLALGEEDEAVTYGEATSIGGHAFVIGTPEPYVFVRAVRDPSVPLLYPGLLVLIAGLAMMSTRLFWYERVMAAQVTEGGVWIGHTEEFHKKWGIYRFRRLMKEGGPPG